MQLRTLLSRWALLCARPGPGLLADISVSKYVDAIPLPRQEQMFARIGIELSGKRIVIISNVKFSALLYTGPEPLRFPSAKLQED